MSPSGACGGLSLKPCNERCLFHSLCLESVAREELPKVGGQIRKVEPMCSSSFRYSSSFIFISHICF